MSVQQKETVRITIDGPVQVGKSIILARIKQMLEHEFGVSTVMVDREVSELSQQALPQSLADWELNMIKKNSWLLTEQGPKVQPDLLAKLRQGFTTLESSDGQYKIVTKFETHDAAWTAYSALVLKE